MEPTVSHAGHGIESTFAAMWSPGLLLFLIIVGVLYTFAAGRWRHEFQDSKPVSLKQRMWFWLGLVLWYAAEGSPIAYYGHHYFFSVHMFQQSLLYLMVPPAMLLGTPGWMLRPLLRTKRAQGFFRKLTSPLFALFLFNFIFSMYHIPMVMDWLMVHPFILTLYKAVFFISAFQLWFPVFCPLPEYGGISDLQKMGYIFLNGILLTPACALIIFAKEPMYAMYSAMSEGIWLMPLLDDQQFGGVVMKIVQEIVYGLALGYTFFHWYRTERKQEDDEEDAAAENFYAAGPNVNRA